MNKNISSTIFLILLGVILILSGFLNMKEKQVRHIIAFKYNENVKETQIQSVNRAFKSLQNKIPGILSLEVGKNFAENLSEDYTHTYMLTFETEEARDAYLPHPERHKFEEMITKLGVVEKTFVMAFSLEN